MTEATGSKNKGQAKGTQNKTGSSQTEKHLTQRPGRDTEGRAKGTKGHR